MSNNFTLKYGESCLDHTCVTKLGFNPSSQVAVTGFCANLTWLCLSNCCSSNNNCASTYGYCAGMQASCWKIFHKKPSNRVEEPLPTRAKGHFPPEQSHALSTFSVFQFPEKHRGHFILSQPKLG